ncbi:MAG: hypothetical protein COX15_01430 [Candidatus Colwellbacteria bacterium CG23_combo_of_CG06-09_8_20_14_all_42_19]|uniref:LTD domain-containing protein n=1 Tax=Candidatus Colwellbacteria bacterium CG23_combo_of_CG06-09_8_20_14_all_42_19 TaxID=1974541 RepID=A0A2H0AL56_9BACT|nr:MAG: hypothetical protein COX15_01430 [Candidatus Colwellbacteria bacterium CG23_combo_of_CG06-09_8_20_14_all_42_19]
MIYIKELIPNPVGSDVGRELIKLINQGEEKVDLDGWKLSDLSGKTFLFTNRFILPQQELELKNSETKISLNNDGDTITLYNAVGDKTDVLSYSETYEGEIILAERFNKTLNVEPRSPVPTNGVLQGGLITNNYDLWPLLAAIFISVLAGLIGSFVLKRVYNLR